MHRILCAVWVSMLALALTACGPKVRQVDEGDPKAVVQTLDVGPQDLDKIASKIVSDMMNEAQIRPASGQQKALIFVSTFENRTGDVTFPTAQLVRTVVNALTRTGVLEAMTEDERANETTIAKRKLKRQSGIPLEDYTLSGSIKKQEQRQDDVKQVTYYVDFIVNNTSTGSVVLTSQTKIIKQQTKDPFGF